MISKLKLCLFLYPFLLVGCASYQYKLSQPMREMQSGRAENAASILKKDAFQDSKDQLAYLLDYSLAQHIAKNYEESNRGFLLAYDLAELKDYHSVSKIGASLLLNEGMVQYKGEEYERLLVSVYAAINFLMLKDYEAARVEVRRIHERINNLEYEGEKVFTEMPFAYYLSALIWEQNDDLDSAYIDYKNTYKYAPNFTAVKKDILRLSKKLGRWQEHNKYKKEFESVEVPKINKGDGQLVIIYQQGRGPKKRPHPNWPRIPKVYSSNNYGVQAKVKIKETDQELITNTVLDLDDLAKSSMEKQYAGLIAKRMAGVAVKYTAAKQLEKEQQGLGQLAWIAMSIADQADLRQWLSLPASIQVARVFLPKGTYNIDLQAVDGSQNATGEKLSLEKKVKAGEVSFINWRSFK